MQADDVCFEVRYLDLNNQDERYLFMSPRYSLTYSFSVTFSNTEL